MKTKEQAMAKAEKVILSLGENFKSMNDINNTIIIKDINNDVFMSQKYQRRQDDRPKRFSDKTI